MCVFQMPMGYVSVWKTNSSLNSNRSDTAPLVIFAMNSSVFKIQIFKNILSTTFKPQTDDLFALF